MVLLSIRVLPFIDAGREHGKNVVVKSFRDRETFIRFPAAANPFLSFIDRFLPFEIVLVARQRGEDLSRLFLFFVVRFSLILILVRDGISYLIGTNWESTVSP